jgi:transcriptional regulator with XRE-family HTH domain
MSRNNKECQIFGDSIRRLRTASGITQEELADRSGIDRSYIGGVERGDRNPTLMVIAKIAAGLGVPISTLFLYGQHTESEK